MKMIVSIPGIDVNQKRTNGESALFIAARKGDIEKVKLLIAILDIDLEARRENDNKTAAQIAEYYGPHEIAKLIEEQETKQRKALEEQISEIRKKSSFECFVLTTRKVPTNDVYLQFLKELRAQKYKTIDIKAKETKETEEECIVTETEEERIITETETKYVKTRMAWTNVVSETYFANQKNSLEQDIKGKVIERLKEIGAKHPEQLYESCIAYIQEHSVITITFKPGFLKNGLTDFQPLNMWEKDNRKNSRYTKYRDRTEKGMFTFLSKGGERLFFFK
jgi:hypothetical protein